MEEKAGRRAASRAYVLQPESRGPPEDRDGAGDGGLHPALAHRAGARTWELGARAVKLEMAVMVGVKQDRSSAGPGRG